MANTDREVERYLTVLRDKIRERGYTQLEIQDMLGWGRSYISQLFTRQKQLRIDQVLMILSVIGVDPGEFFAEVQAKAPQQMPTSPPTPAPHASLEELRRQIHAVTELLLERKLISTEDLSAAVETMTPEDSD